MQRGILNRSVQMRLRSWALSAMNNSTFKDFQVITMPSLSPTMTHGTISSWKIEKGSMMKPGDILCEIETDKATVGFEVQDEGVLAQVLAQAHTPDIPCGKPIALMVEDAKAYELFAKADAASPIAVGDDAAAAPSTPPASTTTPAAVQTNVMVPSNISPAARHLAASRNVDLSGVKGSGKHGMLTKADVLVALGLATAAPTTPSATTHQAAAAVSTVPVAQAAQPVKSAPLSTTTTTTAASSSSIPPANSRFVDVPNSNMRKVIAKRLSESKSTVPHFYMEMDANLDSIMKLRQQLKKDFDVAVSVNDLVIKAAALALRDVPEANMRWDSKINSVATNGGIDISVAVATPTGLITPILTNAASRGLVDISRTVKDLATRAKDGKLKPEEFQGGSFSISNLGMFGISSFSAVINPPQA